MEVCTSCFRQGKRDVIRVADCVIASFGLMKMAAGFIRVRDWWALSFLHVVVFKLPLI